MAHVITDVCTKCASCTKVCPVTCIHPEEAESGFASVPQLYIDPEECIHCGACVPECPSEAIFPEEDLPADKKGCAKINADYFKK